MCWRELKENCLWPINNGSSEKLVEEFEEDGQADFSDAVQDMGRFRVNAFRQRGASSIVISFIPFGMPKFENLNLPGA